MDKNILRAGFVAVVLMGGLLVTTTAATADTACGPGGEAEVTQETVRNPVTGAMELGTVTTCPDVTTFRTTVISSVTPAVGVDFRNDDGDRTASGLSSHDQFRFLHLTKEGKGGDGLLIKVRQTTQGKGGWGPLYEGWIPAKYTQIPSMFGA